MTPGSLGSLVIQHPGVKLSYLHACTCACTHAHTHTSIISGRHHRETGVVRETRMHLFPPLPDEATVSIPLGEVPLLYSLSEWALDLSSNLTIVRDIRVRTAMQWMGTDRKK